MSGLEQWGERLGRRRLGLERRLADLGSRAAEADTDDDQVIGKIETVQARLGSARALEAAARALAGACRGLPPRASWDVWADSLAAILDALFEPAARDAARDALGGLHGLTVVDEEVEVAEVAATVREYLAAARVPSGRVGRDGVAVLTPLELRGLSFKTVVFLGLAEGGFPARGRPDPLLGDAQRQRIAKALRVRLPLAEDRASESLLLFAMVCEAARDRLVLITPRTDAATGRPRRHHACCSGWPRCRPGCPSAWKRFLAASRYCPFGNVTAAASPRLQKMSYGSTRASVTRRRFLACRSVAAL